MSGTNVGNQTSSDDGDEFPVAAIVCLAVGGYVILIVGIIILKHYCSSRGSCKSQCCEANTEEGGGCCDCNGCAKANEACPCCCKCNFDGCLSIVCGKPKRINCIDIILCNCGGCTERCCNLKCCGGCPRNISCTCCTGCFEDCCNGESEPGTCSCLCLEVKLRSPRGGSSRRSTSAPADVHHFNTHTDSNKQSRIKNGRHDFKTGKHIGDGDSVLSEGFVDNKGRTINNVRLRSSSHSPKHIAVRNRQTSQSSDKDLVVTPRWSDRESSKYSVNVWKNTRKVSTQQEESERNEHAFKKSKSLDNMNNNHNDIQSSNQRSSRRRNSRLRKSVRTGQQSQRFPNHLLVSAESLNTSSSSEKFYSSQTSGRSLPEPFSGGRRPLPAISRVNKTH